MPEITVTETIRVSERDITDEEKYLSHRYNRLVDRCLDWAHLQMIHGTHSTKLALSKSVIASAARLATLENKSQQEEHRIAFSTLLQEMTAIDASSSSAFPEPADDQNEDS